MRRILALIIAIPICALALLAILPAILVGVTEVSTATAARDCLGLTANRPDPFDADERARVRQTWIATCRAELSVEPANPKLKMALARALQSDGQRAAALPLLRELAEQGDAAAWLEIYEMHKSFGRTLGEVPEVSRAEAEEALRKAGELGHSRAILMLAVLLDRGGVVKRNPEDAIRWAERLLTNPPSDWTQAEILTLLGRLLIKSGHSSQQARGVELLESVARQGHGGAKAELASVIRTSDPVRARKLLDEALRGHDGAAIPELVEMLVKGEGGPADPKRALALFNRVGVSTVPGVNGARGRLLIEGKVVQRDLIEGARLLHHLAVWDYDARLELMGVLTAHPEVTLKHPESFIYGAIEAAELREPGALAALIALKLSDNAQFRDRAGGCTLVERAAQRGEAEVAKFAETCRTS